MSSFFDKRFFQLLLIQVAGSLIVFLVAAVVTLKIGSQLDQMTELFQSVDSAVTSIHTLVETDPQKIQDMSQSLKEGAKEFGDGVGDGTASTIDKAKEALERFKSKE